MSKNDLEMLEELATGIQNRIIFVTGRQYLHSLIMDVLLANSRDTKSAVMDAYVIINERGMALLDSLIRIFDEHIEMVEQIKRKAK